MADTCDVHDAEQYYTDQVLGDSSDMALGAYGFFHPVDKLAKYADSEIMEHRQSVARSILETLRMVADVPDDVVELIDVMKKLADDAEPLVRSELMEQTPHIAMYCQEFKFKLDHIVPDHLLPMVVKFLKDTDNQVRKTSQAALLVLLEQGLVDRNDVKEQVFPVIILLTNPLFEDDCRTEAVALLSKMAPLIGKELTESVFLERFASLCIDSVLHVRKVCAANFGDFSNVVGCEITEQILLPKFFYLCQDGVWGVRKACADVFMSVSVVCSSQMRKTELSPLYVSLLQDKSRWVRMAAFQGLGHFIATFADPAITALLHNDNGEIYIADPDLFCKKLEQVESMRAEQRAALDLCPEEGKQDSNPSDSAVILANRSASSPAPASSPSPPHGRCDQGTCSPSKEAAASLTPESTSPSSSDSFNSFQYWRDPLGSLDADHLLQLDALSLDDEDDSVMPVAAIFDDDDTNSHYDRLQQQQQLMSQCNGSLPQQASCKQASSSGMDMLRCGSGDLNSTQEHIMPDARWETLRPSERLPIRACDLNPLDPALPKEPPELRQDIVPQLLIDHFVSMVNPSRADTDSEMARHCAFALPAVALTLGRYNWPLLKETYESLAIDMQWKVRRTLASSIHDLGIILGPQYATSDLIPIFNGFLKDLDEVRIGILKHLYDFLKLFPAHLRREYLPLLSEFLKMDNVRNWRFRLELADQLGYLVPLYEAEEVKTYLSPIIVMLIQDKVSAVRHSATSVNAQIIKVLAKHSHTFHLAASLLTELRDNLVPSQKWVHRQTFAQMCYQIFNLDDQDLFSLIAPTILPPLLSLAQDKVPNVRIFVAKNLYQITSTTNNQTWMSEDYKNQVYQVSAILANDPDTDVRFYSNPGKFNDSELDGSPSTW